MNKESLKYVAVNDEVKLSMFLNMHKVIFPNERNLFEEFHDKLINYADDNLNWLVYDGDKLIGITGIFVYDETEAGFDNNESIWLDWVGVLEEYRHQGYGKAILDWTINYCQNLGRYQFLRLDMICDLQSPAFKIYQKLMDIGEEYTIEDTEARKYNIWIFTKCLQNVPLKKWHNRNLDLVKTYQY